MKLNTFLLIAIAFGSFIVVGCEIKTKFLAGAEAPVADAGETDAGSGK